MDNLYLKCLDLVKKYSKCEDEKVCSVLASSILAISLYDEKLVQTKMPNILKELDVYCHKMTVLEMAHKFLNNYNEDSHLSKADACVTRSLEVDSDNGCLSEQKSLLVSLYGIDNNYAKIVSIVTHELIHLLRFGEIVDKGKYTFVYDGVSVAKYNKETGDLTKKHYYLEEGIVEHFTDVCLNNLINEIDNNNDIKSFDLLLLKKQKDKIELDDGALEKNIIESLCGNSDFRNHVADAFYDVQTPSSISFVYNDVMGSPSAYTHFSRDLDGFMNEMSKGDCSDMEELSKLYLDVNNQVAEFSGKKCHVLTKM